MRARPAPIGAVLIAALAPGAAAAHAPDGPVSPADIWHHWTFDPWFLVPLLLVHLLYGRGVLALWARAGRGRGIAPRHVAAFLSGEFVLVLALVSPLDSLGETLFAAHMVQHALLITAAPLLLLAGRPGAALPWGLPAAWRRGIARAPLSRGLGRAVSWLTRPLPAALAHGLALWLWHAPTVFEAALASRWVHTLEHASFFGTALMFWFALIRSGRSRATVASGFAAAFVTLLHGGFLSALITFAPRPIYGWYHKTAPLWGLSALEDQQLAGLIMGAPLGMIYLAAGLILAARLLEPSTEPGPAGQ